jgi:hypothetical protein
MRKAILTAVAGLAIFAFSNSVFAGDTGNGKEKTITGEAKCAKCALKESDKCQTVIQTKAEDGKVTTCWLASNDVAKDFHQNVCRGSKKVTATGVVTKEGDKLELAADKIALAK